MVSSMPSWKVQTSRYLAFLVSLRLIEKSLAAEAEWNFLSPLGAETSLTSWTLPLFSKLGQRQVTLVPLRTVILCGEKKSSPSLTVRLRVAAACAAAALDTDLPV